MLPYHSLYSITSDLGVHCKHAFLDFSSSACSLYSLKDRVVLGDKHQLKGGEKHGTMGRTQAVEVG